MTMLGIIKDFARQELKKAHERKYNNLRIERHLSPILGTQIKHRR